MPSEERVRLARDPLTAPIDAFRSTLLAMVDEIQGYLATHQLSWEGLVAQVAAELGPFAVGRINAERFASVVDTHQVADPATAQAVERTLAALTDMAARVEALCRVEVAPGGSLHEAVSRALGEIGRAFAAARIVAAARVGRRWPDGGATAVDALSFPLWTRNERRLGPPLVVDVQGSDVRAAALSEFLDGRQRIVLVVEGECAPAPLARLVAPGTFVLQTLDGAGLGRLAAWDGPGIAALVPAGAAQFVHDPAAGSVSWERITAIEIPDQVPRRALGGLSAAQQGEELELLRSLATRPAGAPTSGPTVLAGAGAAPPGASVEKLAAWLLSQVNLSDLG